MYEESGEIKLIPQRFNKDADGIAHAENYQPKTVFCKVRSATAAEVFDGGRNGLNPAYTFKVNRWEYENETIVEYEGERLSVYRTFRVSADEIELHVERKAGA